MITKVFLINWVICLSSIWMWSWLNDNKAPATWGKGLLGIWLIISALTIPAWITWYIWTF